MMDQGNSVHVRPKSIECRTAWGGHVTLLRMEDGTIWIQASGEFSVSDWEITEKQFSVLVD